jgi:hypothetical protein
MSVQILIGSTPEEVTNLQTLVRVLNWVNLLAEGDAEVVPFDPEQLDQLTDWINGLHSLLTDVNIFATEDLGPLEV